MADKVEELCATQPSMDNLIQTIRDGDVCKVQELIDDVIRDTNQPHKGQKALTTAMECNQIEMIEMLFKFGACPDPDSDLTSFISNFPMIFACRIENIPWAKLLLVNGVDPYEIDSTEDCCPLEYLTVGYLSPGKRELTRLLLDHEFDRRAKIETNRAVALKAAVYIGDTDKIKALLQLGCSPNKVGDSCLLNLAIREKLSDVAELLIDHGADINLCGMPDGTPLITAVTSRQLDVVKMLLNRGANIDQLLSVVTKNAMALKDARPIYFDMGLPSDNDNTLLRLGCSPDAVRHTWLGIVRREEVTETINQLAFSIRHERVDSTDCYRYVPGQIASSALMEACGLANLNLVNELISLGASVNLADLDGHTALHVWAIRCTSKYTRITADRFWESHLPILKVLLDKGADVNAIVCNSTPLDTLLDEMHEIIMEHRGCRVNCRDTRCWPVAVLKAVGLLIAAGAHTSSVRLAHKLVNTYTGFVGDYDHIPWIAEVVIPILETVAELVKLCVLSSSLLWVDIELIHRKALKYKDLKETSDFLKDFKDHGFSLQSACRIKIRQAIRPPLMVNINSDDIPLPQRLKTFVMFNLRNNTWRESKINL